MKKGVCHAIGYARVSTEKQDLQVQREKLAAYGVDAERIYFDHGRSGRNIERAGLGQVIVACRAGDTLVVTKLDRLARSVHDASGIAQDLQQCGVALQIGRDVYDPDNPTGRLLFNVLTMVAEFESDLSHTLSGSNPRRGANVHSKDAAGAIRSTRSAYNNELRTRRSSLCKATAPLALRLVGAAPTVGVKPRSNRCCFRRVWRKGRPGFFPMESLSHRGSPHLSSLRKQQGRFAWCHLVTERLQPKSG
ncbi:recombinase family protein [Corynebacterium propinquum]|uniref:recombinase family protein n=1 Tax=Corynebacterium propinquum TaxID=43769 RepID=UPI00345EF08F